MEEVQISELTEFASLQRTDLFVAVDSTVTKKIQYGSILNQLSGDLFLDDITGYTGLVGRSTGELKTQQDALTTATGVLSAATGEIQNDLDIFTEYDTGTANFCIVGEHTGAMTSNSDPFSFGDGSAVDSTHGVVIPFDCQIIAMSLDIDTSSTTDINLEMRVNQSLIISKNLTGRVSSTSRSLFRRSGGGGEGGDRPDSVNPHMDPISVSAGNVINFHVDYIEDGTDVNSARMAAFFSQL